MISDANLLHGRSEELVEVGAAVRSEGSQHLDGTGTLLCDGVGSLQLRLHLFWIQVVVVSLSAERFGKLLLNHIFCFQILQNRLHDPLLLLHEGTKDCTDTCIITTSK